jgi:hypothetical protein
MQPPRGHFAVLNDCKSCNNGNKHNTTLSATLNVNVFIKEFGMSYSAQVVVPISEARARLPTPHLMTYRSSQHRQDERTNQDKYPA